MRLFLAGGISGNLKPYWQMVAGGEPEAMRIFIAGTNSRSELTAPVCGAQINEKEDKFVETLEKNITQKYNPYILESFYYADAVTEKLLPFFGDFLLDSGAYTFMMNSKTAIDWDEYIKRYADFIVRNDVKKFFELDIDSIVGYEKVLEYRETLEKLTGRKCIPVWHSNRGLEEFTKTCKEYDYVAVGGIVGKDYPKEAFKYFPWFIREAHKYGAKIHALGFTQIAQLPKFHFDSVDSTAWTCGNRYGYLQRFNGSGFDKVPAPPGKRLADPRKVAVHNFIEWCKYQKYAETNL